MSLESHFHVLCAVISRKGWLVPLGSDSLKVLLPPNCSSDLWGAIRNHKKDLLTLVRLLKGNAVMVSSGLLGSLIVWTVDDATRVEFVRAGAPPGIVYTMDELQKIVRSGITGKELVVLAQTKSRFEGKVRDPSEL